MPCTALQLLEDVHEESNKYGRVMGISVPKPPPGTLPDEPNRVYLLFETPDQAKKARDVFHGRSFDGNSISARFVGEDDFERASAGAWAPLPAEPPSTEEGGQTMTSLPPPPGALGWLCLLPGLKDTAGWT